MEYASLITSYIKPHLKDPSLKAQYVYNSKENKGFQSEGFYDPIGDSKRLNAPQLIHRYKNRILFLPTKSCPIICRFCFRKNEIQNNDLIFEENFTETFDYIKGHEEISEIIFSGGDPLILSNKKIRFYLEEFSKIEHIKFIRFHTKTPMVWPQRITKDFEDLLTSFSQRFKISLALHCNHQNELMPEVIRVIESLKKLEVNLISQTVLLKGVNDNVDSLKNLFLKLSSIGVIPYYLHHPDKVKGAMHFYLGHKVGYQIYSNLKKEISGWMLPRYVIDSPEANGKINVKDYIDANL